jgi:hypothetical protein
MADSVLPFASESDLFCLRLQKDIKLPDGGSGVDQAATNRLCHTALLIQSGDLQMLFN